MNILIINVGFICMILNTIIALVNNNWFAAAGWFVAGLLMLDKVIEVND